MPALCLQTPHQSPLSGPHDLRRKNRSRKRGKRAGVLVRLRCRAFRPPLPTILLANVQSLDNKLCELRARISYQQETRDFCIICLTETWMSAMVPDSAIELTGFSAHRLDRTKKLTGKSRGGGICFLINNSWCDERNIHSIKSFCSPDLEFQMLLCRPFWLPREFTAIIITAVYIPPQANTDQALKELYGNISEQETVHPVLVRWSEWATTPHLPWSLTLGILSPLLYSLYTHDCTVTHSSNVIVKFADDTTVIGLITDSDETAYREEVSILTKWCQENHHSLNFDKLVVDFRRHSREHTSITIDKTPVEWGNRFKFLCIHITEDLKGLLTQMQCWRRHISASSSWDGWGSLEWAPVSLDPSTPALWKASWPAASPRGLETAPLATAKLCKGSCELPATLLEVSFPPSRTSTPGGV